MLPWYLIFQIDELYSNDRLTAAANAKSEAAILQVKVEGLQSQVSNCSDLSNFWHEQELCPTLVY